MSLSHQRSPADAPPGEVSLIVTFAPPPPPPPCAAAGAQPEPFQVSTSFVLGVAVETSPTSLRAEPVSNSCVHAPHVQSIHDL